MIHNMNLHNEPFISIKNKTKVIEIRLYDEKRKLINIGDIIEFSNRVTNEKLRVVVLNLHKFVNFEELYKNFDKVLLGYKQEENADYNDMKKYYSEEEINKYGVVGIEIKVLD